MVLTCGNWKLLDHNKIIQTLLCVCRCQDLMLQRKCMLFLGHKNGIMMVETTVEATTTIVEVGTTMVEVITMVEVGTTMVEDITIEEEGVVVVV